MSSERLRIVLYSHDAMGIGHVRRNLRVARSLAEHGVAGRGADVLLISGIVEAGAFELPPGVDCLTLPSLCKVGAGRYESRRLKLPSETMINLRAATIAAAIKTFAPHVVIVDKIPHGVAGELKPALELLNARRAAGNCHTVLGVRDILDEPRVVQQEWLRDGTEGAIEQSYDQIWIYGDPAVYETTAEYPFSQAMKSKSRYTGYLFAPEASNGINSNGDANSDALHSTEDRLALCMVGGGEDGAPLASAFAQVTLPAGYHGLIVTGPFLSATSRQMVCRLASNNRNMRVTEFVTNPCELLARADRAVVMGGYNTICEVLAAGKPALVVPRVYPRQEQWIRAARLADMGLVSVLHPDQLNAGSIQQWLDRPTTQTPLGSKIDFGGLDRIPMLLADLVAGRGNEIAENAPKLTLLTKSAAALKNRHGRFVDAAS